MRPCIALFTPVSDVQQDERYLVEVGAGNVVKFGVFKMVLKALISWDVRSGLHGDYR